MAKDRYVFAIFSLTPCEGGDYCRYIEVFDRCDDAVTVLKALEKVNYMFNFYKTVKIPLS